MQEGGNDTQEKESEGLPVKLFVKYIEEYGFDGKSSVQEEEVERLVSKTIAQYD